MGDPVVTNNNSGTVILDDKGYKDDLLIFGGAATVVEGTILARKAVDDAVAADGSGNTGDGTVTLSTTAEGPVVPLVGAYNLECITAVADGGVFKLEDPNGALLSNNLVMTPGAGGATAFELNGLAFTLTDGAANFIVGDKFSLTVVANGKLVPFAIGGQGGAQIARSVLTYDVIADGAGNEAIRHLIDGRVRQERLIINADGDGSNITDAILDQLRSNGVAAISVTELNIQDNQT